MPLIRNCPSCGKSNRNPPGTFSDVGKSGACEAEISQRGEPIEVNEEQFNETIGESKGSAQVDFAPKHIHHWTLRSGAKFRRFLNHFVDVLDVYIKERRERLQRSSQFAFPPVDSLGQALELFRAVSVRRASACRRGHS